MLSDERAFVVTGAIDDVVRCRCTPDAMIGLHPKGWGVGAGAIGRDQADALERVVDTTFLFSTVFVSPHPTGPGIAATRHLLESEGLRYFTPTMAWFTGGPPDVLLSTLPAVSQAQLLEDVIWPACEGRAAIGFVSLVRVRRADLTSAIIRTSVVHGREHVPSGSFTTDPELRERFFDLAPLSRRPHFTEGFAWLVGVSVRRDDSTHELAAIRARMVARPDARHHTAHCHLVLVDDAPGTWLSSAATSLWSELHASAASSIAAQAARALAVHSDAATVMTPLATAVWSFRDEEVRSWR
jgi:hypothetical protein